MKQSFKYGLILILTFLLHSLTMEAMDCTYSTTTVRQDQETLSQEHPSQRAIECLYHFYSTQTCDMSHTADVSHIPTDRTFSKLIACFREHRSNKATSFTYLPHLSGHYSDPITYYIYGLRKIVI